jgi:acyl-CoA dehydrogenase
VPASAIISGVPAKAVKTAMKVLDRGRIHISALATGMGERLIEESVQYATQRIQFGEPISHSSSCRAWLPMAVPKCMPHVAWSKQWRDGMMPAKL